MGPLRGGSGRRELGRVEVGVDEGEAAELVLVDGMCVLAIVDAHCECRVGQHRECVGLASDECRRDSCGAVV